MVSKILIGLMVSINRVIEPLRELQTKRPILFWASALPLIGLGFLGLNELWFWFFGPWPIGDHYLIAPGPAG